MPMDEATNQTKGFAFIEFSTPQVWAAAGTAAAPAYRLQPLQCTYTAGLGGMAAYRAP